jgi:hypothetical protein
MPENFPAGQFLRKPTNALVSVWLISPWHGLSAPPPSQYDWNPLLRIKNILRNIFD